MYAVVGCSECAALWIVETGAESSQCPRCGTTRPLAKRAKLATAEDEDRARDLRTQLLAERRDVDGDVASFTALADDVEVAGIDDETYLAGSGLDPEAVATAGDEAEGGLATGTGGGTPSGGSASRREVIEGSLQSLDAPTRDDVVAYATDRGVPADDARSILDKLVSAGEATERDGVYRRL